MLNLLGVRAAALSEVPPADDDWYMNLLWIERRKCLLLTHVRTLFPIVVADVRKADIVPIGPYVVELIEHELASEGAGAGAFGHLEAADVQVAKTASRSILGVMNNTALLIRYRVAAMGGIDLHADGHHRSVPAPHAASARERMGMAGRACRRRGPATSALRT